MTAIKLFILGSGIISLLQLLHGGVMHQIILLPFFIIIYMALKNYGAEDTSNRESKSEDVAHDDIDYSVIRFL